MTEDIKKLVLTGGPCAGKTTAKSYLQQKLADLGFRTLFVPEAPTLLMENGVTALKGVLPTIEFQRSVLSLSISMEREFDRAAQHVRMGKPVVIRDRGKIDQEPYTSSRAEFEMLLAEHGLKYVSVRDAYDAVFHLRTAALGAEAAYSSANNASRYETLDQARITDQRTLDAWVGHPHLRVIPNTGTFDQKLKHLLAEICVVLGIPEPLEIERRFLIQPPVDYTALTGRQEVTIEQFYLMSPQPEETLRFRKRSQWGEDLYFKTIKRPGPDPATRIETETRISAEQYEFGKHFILPDSRFVRKKRTCFVYEEQYFELDDFTEPQLDYHILEIELATAGSPIRLPPFLNVEAEVTGDASYSNYALAFKK